MKLKYRLFTLLFFLPVILFSQGAYYITVDDEAQIGAKVIDRRDYKNSKYCHVMVGDEQFKYTPHEVKEYGLDDGSIYVAKEIEINDNRQLVFLQRLEQGDINLYFYKGRKEKMFFYETNDKPLTSLPRQSGETHYKQKLEELTDDFPDLAPYLSFISYRKKPMAEFISRYNRREFNPIPFFKFGAMGGYYSSQLKPAQNSISPKVKDLKPDQESGYTAGLFIDKPIAMSFFSWHIEFLYSRYTLSHTQIIEEVNVDFLADLSTITLPVQVRYAYPFKTLRPFVNTGLLLSYNLKNDYSFYQCSYDDYNVTINDINSNDIINRRMYGITIGGGFEWKISMKHSVFFEFRYKKAFEKLKPGGSGNEEIQFLTSINI
ncbi:MAG: PorT family protein [Bacteroidales bacterium]|nr:PorT family protein [Bacteroidales bacterium]